MELKMWGNWRFEREENSLIISKSISPGEEEKDLYAVDLERCNSSAAILDWIVQISQKLWITREDIGNLVEALDDIFSLQSNFCGSEFEHSDGKPGYAKRSQRSITNSSFQIFLLIIKKINLIYREEKILNY